MATVFSGLVIGFVNYWQITVITLALGPFIVAAGGISNIFLHRLAGNIQDAYAEATSIAEQILVETPGRLRDHVENTAGIATRFMGVKVLVLDDADQLLDMGFRKEIEKIIFVVPKQRQTLLFSATVPPEVHQICHISLKRNHEFINNVEEGSEETHSQVQQMHLVSPLESHFSHPYVLLKEHIADDVNYKIGVSADRQQYIHRLGRTRRKGKEGQGILLLALWEEFFLSTIKDLPISKANVPLIVPETKKKVERA